MPLESSFEDELNDIAQQGSLCSRFRFIYDFITKKSHIKTFIHFQDLIISIATMISLGEVSDLDLGFL